MERRRAISAGKFTPKALPPQEEYSLSKLCSYLYFPEHLDLIYSQISSPFNIAFTFVWLLISNNLGANYLISQHFPPLALL